MFLEWKIIYSVNVKELDEQHQKMFIIINNLFEAKKDYSQDKIKFIVKELKEYGSFHLGTEEKYFKQFDYPDQKIHILQHDKYREQVSEFEKRINQSNDQSLVLELINFLKDWWLNHIQHTNQEYSNFFNQHGLI